MNEQASERALTLFISIIFMGKMSIKIHKTMQPGAFYEFIVFCCWCIFGARVSSYTVQYGMLLLHRDVHFIIRIANERWYERGARQTCIDSGSFDFQREIPILFAVVCRVHTHGTNVIQNECAFQLCSMLHCHNTVDRSAHRECVRVREKESENESAACS